MRSREVIEVLSPCDNDLTDRSLQSLDDARRKGVTICSNLGPCIQRSSLEGISCTRRVAQQMAVFAKERMDEGGLTRQVAIAAEVNDYLASGPDGKFWAFRNGEWIIVQGKEKAMVDIASFADTIIGQQDD
jgi:hypothetical protein